MRTTDLPAQLWLAVVILACLLTALAAVRNWRARQVPALPVDKPLLAYTGVVLLAIAVTALWVVPSGDKLWLTELGIVAGGVLGLLSGLLRHDEPRRDWLARAGIGLGVLAIADSRIPDPVLLSYLVAGGVLGLAAVSLCRVLGHHPRAGQLVETLAVVAVVASGVIWGDRSLPHASLGSAWALGCAAIALLSAYAASWLPSQWAVLGSGILAAGIAYPLATWTLQLKPPYLYPFLLGLLFAVALGLLVSFSERSRIQSTLPLLVFVVVAGGFLLLTNRLYGMYGVTLAGIGLATLAMAGERAQRGAAILLAVFAGRAFLQVFLDRTYLHQYGVDLTRSYTSFGLLAALFLPTALISIRRRFSAGGLAVPLEAILLLLFPLAIGYFIHIDPLAAYVAGLLVVTMVAGTLPTVMDSSGTMPLLLPPLLLSAAPFGLLAATWLIKELNAPRLERVWAMVAVLVVLAVYLVVTTWRQPSAEPTA